jgi:gliding motility-associated-like protein
LTINDENGCSKVFDLEIIEPSPLSFSEYGYNPAYCRLFDYQSGNGVVYGAAIGGTPDYDYLWTNLDNGETSINSTWGGLNPGNYELLVIDANGCVLEQSLVLDSLNPIAAFTINSDQLNSDYQGTAPVEVSFINESENFADSTYPDVDTVFFWNLDHPTADWQITTDYFESIDTTYLARGNTYTVDVCLVAINKNGCTDTTCKLITIYEPIVFNNVNIFSPNGDGINDGFTFDFKSASIDQFSCLIVNRWGVIVGELNNIHDVWLGTDKNGNPCSDGVYFYTYQATSDNDTNFEGQGTVQIIGSK